jgi:hypothetical protein
MVSEQNSQFQTQVQWSGSQVLVSRSTGDDGDDDACGLCIPALSLDEANFFCL